MRKTKFRRILNKKKNNIPIVCLTSYSSALSEILDKFCDIILVGDSLGMNLYGMQSTKNVTLDTMILHAQSVTKKSKRSLVIVDMPYKTYTNKKKAFSNAKKILRLTKCDGVKLEGGQKVCNIIKHLVKKGIPVMGHIGLLPQFTKSKFRVMGRSDVEKKRIMDDAKLVAKSGAFAIVIECVLEKLATEITNRVKIPTIGIGASKHCDGQILVIDDLIGLSNINPKFVKKYSNLKKIIQISVKKFRNDVIKRKFPGNKQVYN